MKKRKEILLNINFKEYYIIKDEAEENGESITETIIKNALKQIKYNKAKALKNGQKENTEEKAVFKYEATNKLKEIFKDKYTEKELNFIADKLSLTDTEETIKQKFININENDQIKTREAIKIKLFLNYKQAEANDQTLKDETEEEYYKRKEPNAFINEAKKEALKKLTDEQLKKYYKTQQQRENRANAEEWQRLIEKLRNKDG